MSKAKRERAIKAIALKELRLETLKARNSDRLDFHEHGVLSVADALRAAYDAGRSSGIAPPRLSASVRELLGSLRSVVIAEHSYATDNPGRRASFASLLSRIDRALTPKATEKT